MRVLVFVNYYLPGDKAGGPIRSIANIVQHLGKEFEFLIATSDRDSGDKQSYPGIQVDEWNTVGDARVMYMSPGRRKFRDIIRLIREVNPDLVYLNSAFGSPWTLFPLLARRLGLTGNVPFLLAPRGEFSHGALAIKAVKKKLFLALARITGLYRNIAWQASTEYEGEDIRRVVRVASERIIVASDLPAAVALSADDHGYAEDVAGKLRIVFLSRVSETKNLLFALQCLQKVSANVEFDVYGAVGDEPYWQSCLSAAAGLGGNVAFSYKGAIPHTEVIPTLRRYDLFFLPTYGENYGHAIIEAMLAGLPVLISDQTPWRNLRGKHAGWDFPLDDIGAFVWAIDEYARLSMEDRRTWRRGAREYAFNVVASSEDIERNRAMLRVLCLSFATMGL